MPSLDTRSSTASPSGSWPRPRWPYSATHSSSCSTSEVRPFTPSSRLSKLTSFDPPVSFENPSGGAFSSLVSLAWNKRNYHSHGASGTHNSSSPYPVQVFKLLANLRMPHRPPSTSPLRTLGMVSGAIYALASFFAFAAPRAQFLLFFVVPMPAWACIGGIACFDVYNAFTRRVRRLFSFFCLGRKKSAHRPSSPLRLISFTVPYFGLSRARRRVDGRCPLLDHANTV